MDDTFEAWHAPSGAWGGRVGVSSFNPAAPQDLTVMERHVQTSGTEVEDWAARAINAPFFEPPPSQVLSSIHSQLVMNNNDHSHECKGTLPGWTELVQPTPVPVATQPEDCWRRTLRCIGPFNLLQLGSINHWVDEGLSGMN